MVAVVGVDGDLGGINPGKGVREVGIGGGDGEVEEGAVVVFGMPALGGKGPWLCGKADEIGGLSAGGLKGLDQRAVNGVGVPIALRRWEGDLGAEHGEFLSPICPHDRVVIRLR